MRLFLVFAILCGLFYNVAYGKGSLDIDMKLKALNKPALKTIKSEDGDIIDCIDIYKQHAFDHPALRNHKIQMKPSIEFGTKKTTIPNNGSSEQITSQIWSKSGNCPKGTVPVRRVSREDISRASSPSHFGRKTPHRYSFLDKALQHKGNFNITAEKITHARPKLRSEAVLIALGFNFIGAQSDINVWNPPRVQASDYSSAQIWLLGGLSDTFESIEAGWAVNPRVFGDSRTRLFTYWTKDGYTKTGCVNLLCAGFVQTTTKFALGAAIEPVSTTSQKQHYITVSMFLDPNSGNWWLTCAKNVIGYWPGTLFTYLKHSATAVQWGGEVHSPNVGKKPHTRTSMGSGQWASYLWAQACYHTNIRIKDYSKQIKYPTYLSEYADEYDCYSTKLHRKTYMSEPHFYFGGPGQNSRCP
ncbi:Neprosin activation peptide [Arabidopsis suecica]|uniref:Neprosin activation peptide n=1 Tax=Arabidopsis suecica TaxID=45249 RepID=A0A8T1ZC09_ARASU|nr:Neprosin activation peptide [Arabidopsis suecica]